MKISQKFKQSSTLDWDAHRVPGRRRRHAHHNKYNARHYIISP